MTHIQRKFRLSKVLLFYDSFLRTSKVHQQVFTLRPKVVYWPKVHRPFTVHLVRNLQVNLRSDNLLRVIWKQILVKVNLIVDVEVLLYRLGLIVKIVVIRIQFIQNCFFLFFLLFPLVLLKRHFWKHHVFILNNVLLLCLQCSRLSSFVLWFQIFFLFGFHMILINIWYLI